MAEQPSPAMWCCNVDVSEMGGDNAETYEGLEAGFRLHVSSTFAAIKVRQRYGSPSCTVELEQQQAHQVLCLRYTV